jgi:hypothetical protein
MFLNFQDIKVNKSPQKVMNKSDKISDRFYLIVGIGINEIGIMISKTFFLSFKMSLLKNVLRNATTFNLSFKESYVSSCCIIKVIQENTVISFFLLAFSDSIAQCSHFCSTRIN